MNDLSEIKVIKQHENTFLDYFKDENPTSKNTDYRPFINDKKKNPSSNKDKSDDSVKIDKTIAYFKINFDFIIETFYSTDCSSNSDEKITKEKKSDSKEDKKNYKWSLDISNMHKKKDNKYFILFAISRIKVDEDMKGTEKNNDDKNKLDKTKYEPTNKCKLQDENIRTANKSNKGIAIYHFNEKFKYPQIIRFVLDNWYTFDEFSDCTNRLLTCIYDKYFVITKYISGTQSLEVYDLAKMEHEIDAKFVGNIVNEYNHYFFAVSGLLLGFTQVNTIKLFYMENGLQVASKKFDGIKKIYLLEFFDNDEKLFIIGECPDGMIKVIIWDLYDTGKHKLIELDDFPITKANIDDIYTLADPLKNNVFGKQPNGKDDKNHIIYYDGKTNFKQIVNDREPWVPGGCERTSYCIYYNEEGTETETLQLIVGGSTVQIWHEIKDDSKKEDELPNKGEAFLEYIWSNRIPVKQEGKKTRLRIEKFEYGPNYGSKSKINDFYLKVYWFERSYSSKPEEHKKMTEQEIIKEEDDDIDRIEKELKQINSKDNDLNEEEKEKKRQEIINNCVKVKIREKVIQGKDVIKKSHAARHACKALEHIRKRYKKNFRLLDVRYNLMKNLILADCNRLIKFKSWPGKNFLKDDDFDFGKRDQQLKKPENNMELAIYYCRGRELKDAIIVAYFLEYYSRNPTNCVGWLCTVSKAIPLLFKYNYDDFARKLFIRCFADQGHLLGQDPDEIIPKEYLERYNNDTKFRALIPMVKLKSDECVKLKWYDHNWIWDKFKNLKNKFKEYRNFEKSPLALRVVPFPGFTINNIKRGKKNYNLFETILNRLTSILIPRRNQIKWNETNKLSPFSRMVLCENNDDIYDNPAIEAVIDFLSLAYLDRSFIVNGNFLLVLIIVFYYLAIYRFIIEVKQIRYRGLKKYFFDLLDIVDMISIILPVTVMSIMLYDFQLSDGFGISEETGSKLVVEISFSIFLIWIQFILFLRLRSAIIPFLWFMLAVIIAFAHTIDPINIKIKESTYSGVATNSLTNETLNIDLKSDFDPKSSDDNPFSTFNTAMVLDYIFLVIILQNILIAFMNGVYVTAGTKGKQKLLRYQANYIATFEALHVHFSDSELGCEPKRIYYFSQAKNFEEWYNTKKGEQGVIYKEFEEASMFMINSIYKEIDYDKYSILTYNDNIKMIIKDFINLGNNVNINTEDLIKRVIDKNSIDEIEGIEGIKVDLETKVRKLNYILEKLKKHSL
ncbi:4056_t:CDS:10 [Rhizophagus irregularis]|nr:4056_t:CDS:10 [Rhizophagus irregularis]